MASRSRSTDGSGAGEPRRRSGAGDLGKTRPGRRIVLFGSRARGDARLDSDYDLLVVLRGLRDEDRRACRRALRVALRGAGVRAEPWLIGEQGCEESKTVIGGLANPAWTEGVLFHEDA